MHVGKQQPRFEIGEPSRHDEIVSREFQPQPACFLDEDKILVRQRQDRDFREVHLLLASEHQQEIERPLETLDVNHERRLVGYHLGREFRLEFAFVRGHDAIRAGADR